MKIKLLRILVVSLLLLLIFVIVRNMNLQIWQMLLLYLIPYSLISYDILGEAFESLLKGDPFDENFLMSIATIGALVIGFLPGADNQFAEAVFVMLFYQVGDFFEDYAEENSRRSISHLLNIRPNFANLERNGKIVSVDPETIAIGETIIVKPGEKVPMDGVVIEGSSNLDTIALTGESMPQSVGVYNDILSGCVNLSGLLKVRVTKTFRNSTASKIIDLVQNASERKSKSVTFISKFAHVYTPIVVILAILLAFIPPLFANSYLLSFPVWLYRALTFLVVSCPCALVISIPLTFFGGIGGASRIGVLIKGGNYMEMLAKTSTVVFDKTGTLTKGMFVVEAVHPEDFTELELLHLAAHVEHFSTHPIALALRQAYSVEDDDCVVNDVHEVAGLGISAIVKGKTVSVGNEEMMQSLKIKVHPCNYCYNSVGTVIHVAIDGKYAGHILISDQIKDDAIEAITELKKTGVSKTVMLTGDQEGVGQFVARKLNIDFYKTQLLPSQKVEEVEHLLQQKPDNTSLIFVGDGINDAPVLARADVGIAMGGLGSDAAIEAADVVLMDDKLSKIAKTIRIARRTIHIAHENTWFAILVKLVVLILATFGLTSMGIAVFADVGVMVLAVMNAMRTLKV